MKKIKYNALSISKTTIASLNAQEFKNVIGGNHPTSSVCDLPDTYTNLPTRNTTTGNLPTLGTETFLDC